MTTPKENFIKILQDSLAADTFIKVNLANYHGTASNLKKLLIKKVIIKKKVNLSIVYRYLTNDITKNFQLDEGVKTIASYIDKTDFRHANLFTINKDYQLQCSKKGSWKIFENKASSNELPTTSHDKNKKRNIVADGKQYLYDLKITDAQGKVRPHGQDKYKQINHYIEILSKLLKELPKEETVQIVDMGSGKGYLTFALYDYLLTVLKQPAIITGIEYRKDLVELCNSIAAQSNFDKLSFTQGSIENYQADKNLDMLIALHACDTATDDAIYKGIEAQAELIVVAPCCHKQIRKEMKKGTASQAVQHVTKHGIFMERQAEIITDTLRGLYLEQAGYSTKLFDFIATEHTPKNIIIIAQKRKEAQTNKEEIATKIEAIKKSFGIEKHYLEELLN